MKTLTWRVSRPLCRLLREGLQNFCESEAGGGGEYLDSWVKWVSIARPDAHVSVEAVKLHTLRGERVHVRCHDLWISVVPNVVPAPVVDEICVGLEWLV